MASNGSMFAASGFANPAFETKWNAGEASVPNFWGPLANATSGMSEPYVGSTNAGQDGARLVQYFDKGRMELNTPTTGAVTSGLLATELIGGKMQIGDTTFQPRAQPAIPVAGDPDNPGPTYAALATKANTLLLAAQDQSGKSVTTTLTPTGDLALGAMQTDPMATLATFDTTTQHNVARAFADYRQKVGLTNIGYGIAEPFFATVKVGGQPKSVLIQVFERRVLTYTASNPDSFKVEMGNIGQHYYQWRYPPASTAPAPASPLPSPPTPPGSAGTYQLAATTSPQDPTRGSLVTVTAILTKNGVGVAEATMDTTWHLGGADVTCSFGPSASDGSMRCQRVIDRARPGYTSRVEVFVTYMGQQFMTVTTFVAKPAPAF